MATGLKNLKIYQMAADLEIEVYNLTKTFPREEKYRSVDQLNRSASATTNNIAEAYNNQSTKHQIHILRDIVICEAEETCSGLRQCARKGFIAPEKSADLIQRYTDLVKATYGYIRFLSKRAEGQTNRPANRITGKLDN